MRPVAAFSIALALIAGGTVGSYALSDDSGDASSSRPSALRITLEPARASVGQWVSIEVHGDTDSLFNLATYALFQGRQHGKWRSIYGLTSRAKTRAGDRKPVFPVGPNTGFLADALPPGAPDHVRIPPVEPGRYRLVKDVTVARGSENVTISLSSPVRVVAR